MTIESQAHLGLGLQLSHQHPTNELPISTQYIPWEGNGGCGERDTSDSEVESCTSWYEDAERSGFGEDIHVPDQSRRAFFS